MDAIGSGKDEGAGRTPLQHSTDRLKPQRYRRWHMKGLELAKLARHQGQGFESAT